MKRFISTFMLCVILSMVMPSAQGINVKETEETVLCYEKNSSSPEDWETIKENVRAINFEKGESTRVDILRNTITGKLFAQDGNWRCEVFPSDRSGYRYYFNAGYHGLLGKYYFNL